MAARTRYPRGTAVLALVACSAAWGTSFSTIKICGQILNGGAGAGTSEAFGPLLVTALRFTVAVPLLLIFWKAARELLPRRGDLAPLLRVAVPMSAGFLIQAAGLAWTTATISAFLTNLTVCITPALEWMIQGKRTTWRLAMAVALATGGVALMTIFKPESASAAADAPRSAAGAGFGIGEVLTIICAVAFSFQVLWTGESSEHLGSGRLTMGTFIVVALVSWTILLVAWPAQVPRALWAAALSWKFWGCFAVIVLLATIGAMVLMNVFQRSLRPSEAAVIYTTEPVFAGVFAWLLRGKDEALGLFGLLGGALLIAADLLAAVRVGERQGPGPEPPPAAKGGPEP